MPSITKSFLTGRDLKKMLRQKAEGEGLISKDEEAVFILVKGVDNMVLEDGCYSLIVIPAKEKPTPPEREENKSPVSSFSAFPILPPKEADDD